MADIADNAEITVPGAARASRSGQSKRRAPSAPAASIATSDTDSAQAQAAQRLAQPGEPPRDESTLDLFHDDPQYAPAPALEGEVRHNALSGFEQPDAAKAEAEPLADRDEGAVPALPPAVAATPRRAVRAKGGVALPSLPDGDAQEPANADEAAVAPVAEDEPHGGSPAGTQSEMMRGSAAAAAAATDGAATVASATNPVVLDPQAPSAPPAGAESGLMPRTAPEPDGTPDGTRVAALADTVNALHGVIADQRRAAADLSRRMKWLLAGVTGALLVTVAAGVIQTVVLARLASDASAQQQRIAQLMQDQQTALTDTLARLAAQPTVPASEPAPAPAATRAASPHHTQHAATHAHRVHPASH